MKFLFCFIFFLFSPSLIACSYLDPPFISFLGQFYTNPGTLNNFISNYNLNNTVTPWWNPQGVNYMRLLPSPASSALSPSLGWLSPANASLDCALSASLSSSPSPTAKLVDIDPDDQFISQIFGMVLTLALPNGAAVSGAWAPSGLRGQWFAAQCPLPDFHPQFGNDTRQRAGDWQSALTGVTWTGDFSCSPLLQRLHQLSPASLSVKLNTDDFNNDINDPAFCHGRLRAVIGPAFPGEPVEYIPDRMLWAASPAPPPPPPVNDSSLTCKLPDQIPFNFAPFHMISLNTSSSFISSSSSSFLSTFSSSPTSSFTALAFFDLGNAVPLITPHGDSLYPTLLPFVASPSGALVPLAGCEVLTTREIYEQRAGITVCALTAAQEALLSASPLVLQDPQGHAALAEQRQGLFVFAEPRCNRLEAGEAANLTLYARQFGLPAAGLALDLALVPSPMRPRADRVNDVPLEGIKFPSSLVSGPDGSLAFQVFGGNVSAGQGLPPPRVPLDSQIYFISGGESGGGDGALLLPRMDFLVFNSHPPQQGAVTWAQVEPILAVYSALFPGMDAIVELDDEAAVEEAAPAMLYTLNLPHDDPGYMPVTRDLSASHLMLLNQFLSAAHPAPFQDPEAFAKRALERYQVSDDSKKIIEKLCPFFKNKK